MSNHGFGWYQWKRPEEIQVPESQRSLPGEKVLFVVDGNGRIVDRVVLDVGKAITPPS